MSEALPAAGAQRLHKDMRLRKRAEFVSVQQGGATISGRLVMALAQRPPTAPTAGASAVAVGRVGLTVTKKIGDAVTRNRVKRMIREWLRTHGWVSPGWDVVVVAREAVRTVRTAEQLAPDLSKIQRQLVAWSGAGASAS